MPILSTRAVVAQSQAVLAMPFSANLEALFLSSGTGTLRGSPSNTEQSGNLETVRAALIAGGDTTVFMKQWDDASGNVAHAVQTTTNLQPQFVANAIGLAPGGYWLASGGGIRLAASISPLTQGTAYVVCKLVGLRYQTPISNGDGDVSKPGFRIQLRLDGAVWFRVIEDDFSSIFVFHSATYSVGATMVFCIAFDGDLLLGNVNGTEEANATAIVVTTGTSELYIGTANSGSEEIDGYITAVACYSAVHDASQRAAMVTWLTDNYS